MKIFVIVDRPDGDCLPCGVETDPYKAFEFAKNNQSPCINDDEDQPYDTEIWIFEIGIKNAICEIPIQTFNPDDFKE